MRQVNPQSSSMNTSPLVDSYLGEYDDWRGEKLKTLRRIIHDADSEITEEWKWDVPVFMHNGMICAISAFKEHVKINFFKGAALNDPQNLLNSGLESKQHRAIDLRENDPIHEEGIRDLVRTAVALNIAKK